MREAFLQSIRDDPADDATRLIYADWLEENGYGDQAEFIRLQLSLEGLPAFDPGRFCANLRLQEIIENDPERGEDLPEWARRVHKTARYMSYRRGLPAEIHCDPDDWLRHGRELLERHPVEEVVFNWYKLRERLRDWLASALTPRVSRYTLSGQYLTDADVARIARSRSMAGVTKLDLSHNGGIGDRGARALARSPYLANLRELDLAVTDVGPSGFRAITRSARLPNLRRLEFGENHSTIGDADVAELIRSPHRYEKLVLYGTALTDAGIASLCGAPCIAGLEHLDLGRTAITGEGVAAIAGCAGLSELRTLHLANTHIGDAGAAALASSPVLGNLRDLKLLRCEIGPAGGVALARSTALARLTTLDLHFNGLGDEPLVALAGAGRLDDLLDLKLSSNAITSAGAVALANSTCLRRLIRLDLRDNQIDGVGVEALARSENLGGLRLLILHGNRIGAEVATLAASPILRHLRILHLGSNQIDDPGALAFLDSALAADGNLVLHGNPISDAAWARLETALGGRFTLYYPEDLLGIAEHRPNPYTRPKSEEG